MSTTVISDGDDGCLLCEVEAEVKSFEVEVKAEDGFVEDESGEGEERLDWALFESIVLLQN